MSHPKPNLPPETSLLGAIEQIDRYQLVERLGKGGMAEVFRAKLTSIGGFERDVAVKVLLPSYAAEPEFVEMLLDEARIAGGLDHPNILQVLDVGRKGEVFYLVMEYVDGKDLRSIAKLVPGGRIPLGMSLYVMAEMMRGLEAVHDAVDERGTPRDIIHRDISPGNVMVDRRGFVKLGDFGIAHASGRITRTRVGAVKGKSRYMAPEQLAGHPVDQRADLYAVGVTLFEAILGDFARESSTPSIYGPMFTWPERLPKGSMPPDVEAILRRAIADRPEDRYRDAGELRADLEVALHRWAPGYGPDTLSRELRRLLGENKSSPLSVEPRRNARGGIALRPGRFVGSATAEHSMLPPSDRTPVQLAAKGSPTLSSTTVATLGPRFELDVERAAEAAQAIPPDLASRPQLVSDAHTPLRARLNPKLTAALIVAGVTLILIAVFALVASSGSPPVLPVEEPHVTPLPAAPPPAPKVAPLPQVGTLEVLGPAGAGVQVGNISYPHAPMRVELAPGDYVVRLRVGKKHRLVTRTVRIQAGQTATLR